MVRNNRYVSPGALHLRPTTGTMRRVNKLVRLSRAAGEIWADPDKAQSDLALIENELDTHKSRFETFLAELERRAGQV